MKAIAAVDREWGIGLSNKLLAHIPDDQKFFKEKTMGHIVIMGRKTFESLPGKRPLDGRENIVLTRNKDFRAKGVTTASSISELLSMLGDRQSEAYVIGGGSIYEKLLGFCDTAYITRIDKTYEADTWFPDLDQDANWALKERQEERTYFDIVYFFSRYERIGAFIGEGQKCLY